MTWTYEDAPFMPIDIVHWKVFLIGVFTGFSLLGTTTYLFPRNISGVNQELVSVGLAHYDPITGLPIWHTECAK